MQRPRFIKPGEDDTLYPIRNKDGHIEPLIDPDIDRALSTDSDAHTTFVYNRHHHLPIDAQRQKLPIFGYRNHILYLMEKYQTLVLVGETGCGKSTQVPQYVSSVGHSVCVCEPRAVAALSLAARVKEERGGGVGYEVGGARERSTDDGIVFMTERVLLREMFASPLLMQYSCIILDEVHERTQVTDVLMGLLKKIAKKRKNLKLIISSATMDAEFFREFFNLSDKRETKDLSRGTSERDRYSSVILSIQGRLYPVEVFYVEEPVPDYVKATVETVIKIHENEPFGDILAFLTSQEEITTALSMLEPYVSENNSRNKYRRQFPSGVAAADLVTLPMYGSLSSYRQIKVFQMVEANVRKVILSTNVAETSVTIPGIVYVIDAGFHKLAHFSPTDHIESVSTTAISQYNAIQRAARAGRTKAGKCYRLYTEESYAKLCPSVPPEICRSELSSVLLSLKALGIHHLLRFPFPTPPPASLLLSSIETLLALKAIDRDGLLTTLGECMAELTLKPMYCRMLCLSDEFGVIEEMLSICSIVHVDGVFVKGGGKHNMAAKVARRRYFEVAEGDILMYLNIMESYMKTRQSTDEKKVNKICKEWCQRMYLNHKVMEKAFEIRTNLEKLIKDKFQMKDKQCDEPDLGTGRTLRTMKCITSGLFPNAAFLTTSGHYRTTHSGLPLYIAADSSLYGVVQPKWLVFGSVQTLGDKCYMRDLMTIDKQWLLELASHYFREV